MKAVKKIGTGISAVLLASLAASSAIVTTSEEVTNFLGSQNAKLVYTKYVAGQFKESGTSIWFVDFSQSPLTEKRIVDGNDQVRNAIVSPNGEWIAYNTLSDRSDAPKSYICPLRENGGQSRIDIGDGAQPHWWQKPGTSDFYLIWNSHDLEDGWQCGWQYACSREATQTYLRRVNPVTGQMLSNQATLMSQYGNGGRSKAGGWIFSANGKTGIYRIDPNSVQNAQIYEALYFGYEDGCNPSTSPHDNDNDVMVMQNGAGERGISTLGLEEHTYFVIRKTNGEIFRAVECSPKTNDENKYWDTPEWSNHVDFSTVVAAPTNLIEPYGFDMYLYSISADRTLKISNGNDYWPYLWVDPSSVAVGRSSRGAVPAPVADLRVGKGRLTLKPVAGVVCAQVVDLQGNLVTILDSRTETVTLAAGSYAVRIVMQNGSVVARSVFIRS